jgi:hypothetical protein
MAYCQVSRRICRGTCSQHFRCICGYDNYQHQPFSGGAVHPKGVVVDGLSGKVQSDNYCDLAGTNCRDITSLLTGYTETDSVFLAQS